MTTLYYNLHFCTIYFSFALAGHRGTCLRPLHIFALLLLYCDRPQKKSCREIRRKVTKHAALTHTDGEPHPFSLSRISGHRRNLMMMVMMTAMPWSNSERTGGVQSDCFSVLLTPPLLYARCSQDLRSATIETHALCPCPLPPPHGNTIFTCPTCHTCS